MSFFNDTDLVVYKNEKKKVMSGGFQVNSVLLDENVSASNSYNVKNNENSSVSSIFSNLAIPVGLLMIDQVNKVSQYDTTYHDEMLDNSLHERLLQNINPNSRKLFNKRTRKSNNIYNKKSRKNKI